MKNIFLVLTLIAALALSSCSSDDNNTESAGISTGNYWPLAVNNTWNYFGNGIDSEIKIIGTQVLNGKNYFEVKDNSYTNSEIKGYLLKDGAVYFQRIAESTVNANGLVINLDGYEIPLFKDNLAQNNTWNGSISLKARYILNGNNVVLDVKMNYKGTILASNATETVNDVVYTDIIKMRMTLDIVVGNQTSQGSVDYWFAKDVGPIKTIEVGGDLSINRGLMNYTLN